MSSLSGAKWLLLSNIFQKLFTFGINQFIIRQSSPEIFGIAAVQLELLLSTLLFLSREGIRLTLIRTVISDSLQLRQQVVNLSWIPSLLLALTTCGLYLYCPIDIAGMSREVVLLYCVGALFESFGEPWVNLYNNRSQLAPRARADAIAVTMRSLTTLLCVIHLKMGVLGFGIAQTAYGFSHFFALVLSTDSPCLFLPAIPPLAPSSVSSTSPVSILSLETLFHVPTVNTALQMTGTSLLKHVLTEGDRIVLSLSEDHYNQGIYAVTLNYGSLVARLLFQPLEEASRISFAQIAGKIHRLRSRHSTTMAKSAAVDTEAETEAAALVSTLQSSVHSLLRVVLLCGSLLPLFGPLYARLLVKIVLGSRWYSEETVLCISAFCGYLFLMGLNGISEAFVQSAAPAHLFGAMNLSLFLSSFVFYASSPLLIASLTHGTVGIVLANSLSMALRILLNLRFVSQYFSTSPSPTSLLGILPSARETALSTIAFAVLHSSSSRYAASAMTLTDAAYHVAFGAVVFIALAGHHGLSHWREVRDLLRGPGKAEAEKKKED